ncbi:hypothetical protein [Nguyenibacter vanlangensis]|uniref:hypothetical protein n=1 Tax=Nguyenibacter vanlangensis TaxID=1216886 RepID=UPI001C400E9F|nr:hypothetical protein [Nguyenibacter vanlangensis]
MILFYTVSLRKCKAVMAEILGFSGAGAAKYVQIVICGQFVAVGGSWSRSVFTGASWTMRGRMWVRM